MVWKRQGRITMTSSSAGYLHLDLPADFVGTDFGLENIKKYTRLKC